MVKVRSADPDCISRNCIQEVNSEGAHEPLPCIQDSSAYEAKSPGRGQSKLLECGEKEKSPTEQREKTELKITRWWKQLIKTMVL